MTAWKNGLLNNSPPEIATVPGDDAQARTSGGQDERRSGKRTLAARDPNWRHGGNLKRLESKQCTLA